MDKFVNSSIFDDKYWNISEVEAGDTPKINKIKIFKDVHNESWLK